MTEVCELGKPDLHQEKFVIVEAQGEMCLRHVHKKKSDLHQKKFPTMKVKGEKCSELKKLDPYENKSIIVKA